MIRTVTSRWQEAILVCGKCTRRVKGGFGKKGRTPLVKALRAAGAGGRNRRAERGIVETGCLKLCPKRAVVVLDTARPDTWLVVPAGSDIGEITLRLGLSGPSREPAPIIDRPAFSNAAVRTNAPPPREG